MKTETLLPVYFPFTFISPSVVEAVFLCFQGVVVYQPAYARPDETLQSWIDRGLLHVRSPLETTIDKKPLESALRDLKGWGSMHQQADLAFLKKLGNAIEPVVPEMPQIASEIKTPEGREAKETEKPDLSVQLFLHLAQEFDREAWTLREQLRLVDDQYQALQTSFRQDQEEEVISVGYTRQPIPDHGEDFGHLLIEKRMMAWNHLFQADATRSGLLLTDSPSACTYLLDGAGEKVALLDLNFPFRPFAEEGSKLHLPWAEQLSELFQTILGTGWDPGLKERAVQAGDDMVSQMDEWAKSAARPPDKTWSLRCYVVPGASAQVFLNRRCGRVIEPEVNQDGKAHNTVIGLIQETP